MKKLLSVLMLVAMSFSTVSQSYALAAPVQAAKHFKKDGTPDKRFKGNKKHLTKSGKPDMRYKTNKSNAGNKKKKH